MNNPTPYYREVHIGESAPGYFEQYQRYVNPSNDLFLTPEAIFDRPDVETFWLEDNDPSGHPDGVRSLFFWYRGNIVEEPEGLAVILGTDGEYRVSGYEDIRDCETVIQHTESHGRNEFTLTDHRVLVLHDEPGPEEHQVDISGRTFFCPYPLNVIDIEAVQRYLGRTGAR